MKLLITSLVLPLLVACQTTTTDYESFKKAQDYTVPLYDGKQFNKHIALFIFPHPDDEVVCGGTIAALKQQGWEVDLLTLTQGNTGEKETRKKEWTNAMQALGIDHSTLLDLPNNTWSDIEKDKLFFWNENMDSIRHIIADAIKEYAPSLLFTYDELLGGYGHPEHRLTAVAVHDIFEQHKNDSSFTASAIFQITLPDDLEARSLGKLDSYKKAVTTLGKDLPHPDVAFDIRATWPVKRAAAVVYPSQAKTLKKFNLLPNESDTAKHYATFDREYYSVIKR